MDSKTRINKMPDYRGSTGLLAMDSKLYGTGKISVDRLKQMMGGGPSGTEYESGTGVTVDNENHTISADLAVVQEKLVEGDGISIVGNRISATGGGGGTEYEPGTGIDIDAETHEISVDTDVVATKEDLENKQDNLEFVYDDAERIVSIDGHAVGGGAEAVAHDETMTGDGTNEKPLSIQSALDVSNANTAPEYDPMATYPKVGTLCTYNNVLYRSKVAINTAEEWTEAHWEVDSVSAELDGLNADPEWENITSKVGNYDGASITSQSHYITIRYSKKLAMISINGYVTPTSSGKVKIFSFNSDIVPFVGVDILGKNGNNLILVTLRASTSASEAFYSYAITAREVVYGSNVEIAPTMLPLSIPTDMFNEYLATH